MSFCIYPTATGVKCGNSRKVAYCEGLIYSDIIYRMLDRFQFQLCDIQGRLFELSVKQGYDSACFIRAFMMSKCAFALDDIYDRLQWAGEEYILEELDDEVGGLVKSDKLFSTEVMFWAGYLYRYWHFYTGQSSKEIYMIADAKMMNESWLGFHTLDSEMAIDNFIEIYRQKN